MFEDWSNAIKLGMEKYDQSVTCLVDDPRNLEIRSKQVKHSGYSIANKQAYNKYSSNARVKLK